MQNAETIEKALLALLAALLVLALGVGFWGGDYFHLSFAAEDGVVEYGTALFLFLACLVLFRRAKALGSQKTLFGALCLMLYALLFFFAAGEEISWGQRIFGWESGEFFQENNQQKETNLHNLVVGGKHLATAVFGWVLTTVLLIYLLIMPMIYGRFGWFDRLVGVLAIPVPQKRHAAAALLSTLVIAVISAERKWEVYECAFGIMALAIFLMPQNRSKLGG